MSFLGGDLFPRMRPLRRPFVVPVKAPRIGETSRAGKSLRSGNSSHDADNLQESRDAKKEEKKETKNEREKFSNTAECSSVLQKPDPRRKSLHVARRRKEAACNSNGSCNVRTCNHDLGEKLLAGGAAN